MSDASRIYAQIDRANNNISLNHEKIEELKRKKERLKRAKGIIKDNKGEISHEKKSARKNLTDFKNWKGSNYDTYHDLVEGELTEGYCIYANNLEEIIDEINAAIDRINREISDKYDLIDRLRDLISDLYDALARLEEEDDD